MGKEKIQQELKEVFEKCKKPKWDGYDALPVLEYIYDSALQFLESVPSNVPLPSVGSEPDGHLTFDWYNSREWTLSVSVGMKSYIYFAALMGPDEIKGACLFDGKFPELLSFLIGKIYEHRES